MAGFGNLGLMQPTNNDFLACSSSVVASVTQWGYWKALASGARPDGCDWLELRLDMMPEEKMEHELRPVCVALPLLVTMRRMEEGGLLYRSDEERMKMLEGWLPFAHAVDVEIASLSSASSLIDTAKKQGVLVIASSHDFAGTPSLESMLELEVEARGKGADIVKFAFKLNTPQDLQTGCELLARRSGDMAVMGMGEMGPCSRLFYSQLGSCLVYGYCGEVPSAPGQWHASEFKRALAMLAPINPH